MIGAEGLKGKSLPNPSEESENTPIFYGPSLMFYSLPTWLELEVISARVET